MFFRLDPVLEFNPLDDFRHAEYAVEFASFLLCGHHQAKGHGQGGLASEAALGLLRSVPHSGKCAFDYYQAGH